MRPAPGEDVKIQKVVVPVCIGRNFFSSLSASALDLVPLSSLGCWKRRALVCRLVFIGVSGQVASPMCASVSSGVKWGRRQSHLPGLQGGGMRVETVAKGVR